MDRERPQGKVGWACTSRPSEMPALGIESGGRSRHRPHGPVCHHRPGVNGTTDFIPATCGICRVSHPKVDFVHIDLDVKYTCLVRPGAAGLHVRTASARAASSAKCSPGATAPGRTLGEPDYGVPPAARARPGCRRTPLGAGSRPRYG